MNFLLVLQTHNRNTPLKLSLLKLKNIILAYRKPLRKTGSAWTPAMKKSFKDDYNLYLKDELALKALAFLYGLSPVTIRGLAHEWLLPYKKAPITKEEIEWLQAHTDEFESYADAADKLNAVFGNGRNRTSANRTLKKHISIKRKNRLKPFTPKSN